MIVIKFKNNIFELAEYFSRMWLCFYARRPSLNDDPYLCAAF